MKSLAEGRWVYGIHPDATKRLLATERLCYRFNLLDPGLREERLELFRSIVGSVGDNVVVHSPFRCDFGSNITLGDNCTLNYGLTILDEAEVTFGSRVFVGPNVSIYTITHALLPDQRAAGVMRAAPVTIGDDVWICGDVKILPGVTIGRGAVIAAGSVVTESVPEMIVAAGIPCRAVREITDADRIDI